MKSIENPLSLEKFIQGHESSFVQRNLNGSRVAVAAAVFAAISGCTDDPYEAPVDKSNSDADGGIMEDAQMDEDSGVETGADAGMGDSGELEAGRDAGSDALNDATAEDSGIDAALEDGGADAGPITPCISTSLLGSGTFNVQRGDTADFMCTTIKNDCDFPVNLDFIQYTMYGDGLQSDIHRYRLVDDLWNPLSDLENIDEISGSIMFSNPEINLVPGSWMDVCLQGEVANNATCDSIFYYQVDGRDHLIFENAETGEQLPEDYVVDFGYPQVEGNRMTIECTTLNCSVTPLSYPTNLPKGAREWLLLCIECFPEEENVDLYNFNVSHFGSGDPADFEQFYLSEGFQVISGPRILHPVDDSVILNTFATDMESGAIRQFCISADVSPTAVSGSQHGIEIATSLDVNTSADKVRGRFPMQSPLMTVNP